MILPVTVFIICLSLCLLTEEAVGNNRLMSHKQLKGRVQRNLSCRPSPTEYFLFNCLGTP